MKAKLLKIVHDFDENEEGMETLQVVMIVAIAAIVLIGATALGQDIFDWCVNSWLDLSEAKIE